MVYFLIVITLDLIKVICCPIQTLDFITFLWMKLTKLAYIDFGSQGEAILLLLVLISLVSFVFLLFLSFIEELGVV